VALLALTPLQTRSWPLRARLFLFLFISNYIIFILIQFFFFFCFKYMQVVFGQKAHVAVCSPRYRHTRFGAVCRARGRTVRLTEHVSRQIQSRCRNSGRTPSSVGQGPEMLSGLAKSPRRLNCLHAAASAGAGRTEMGFVALSRLHGQSCHRLTISPTQGHRSQARKCPSLWGARYGKRLSELLDGSGDRCCTDARIHRLPCGPCKKRLDTSQRETLAAFRSKLHPSSTADDHARNPSL